VIKAVQKVRLFVLVIKEKHEKLHETDGETKFISRVVFFKFNLRNSNEAFSIFKQNGRETFSSYVEFSHYFVEVRIRLNAVL
jgi:hypothetical protein